MNATRPMNGYRAGWRRALAVAALGFACSGSVWAADDAVADEEIRSIETLLKGGWEIAGYVSTGDNRSSLTLFKHPGETYLVQCLTGYDVTRTPRVYTHCYKLR